MKVLITGHTGFIGAALARQLEIDGHWVTGLSRSDGGDVRDADAVYRAAAGCDLAVHAAYAPVRAPGREILDVAVTGMTSVLRACERRQVRGLLLISSPLVTEVPGSYPDLGAVYGTGKLAAEAMAAAWARAGCLPRLTIARPFNVYGPCGGHDHVIPQFITRLTRLDAQQPDGVIRFGIHGSPDEVRSFCYITDCAAQLSALAEGTADSRPVIMMRDVGVSDPRTVGDVARDIAGVLGRQIEVLPAPGAGPPGSRVPVSASPPRTSFATGLARTVAWYREHYEEVASGEQIRG
jgi:UDP-glucose 4-epimerase